MRRTRRTHSRFLPRWAAGAAALVWILTLASAPSHGAPSGPAAGSTRSRPAAATTYTNPVSTGAVDTFPDPAVIRGKDGLWYAYGTQNPVMQSKGEDGERMLPILRSADMVTWEYAGEVFTSANKPAWHQGSRLWAPDVRYAMRPVPPLLLRAGAQHGRPGHVRHPHGPVDRPGRRAALA